MPKNSSTGSVTGSASLIKLRTGRGIEGGVAVAMQAEVSRQLAAHASSAPSSRTSTAAMTDRRPRRRTRDSKRRGPTWGRRPICPTRLVVDHPVRQRRDPAGQAADDVDEGEQDTGVEPPPAWVRWGSTGARLTKDG